MLDEGSLRWDGSVVPAGGMRVDLAPLVWFQGDGVGLLRYDPRDPSKRIYANFLYMASTRPTFMARGSGCFREPDDEIADQLYALYDMLADSDEEKANARCDASLYVQTAGDFDVLELSAAGAGGVALTAKTRDAIGSAKSCVVAGCGPAIEDMDPPTTQGSHRPFSYKMDGGLDVEALAMPAVLVRQFGYNAATSLATR